MVRGRSMTKTALMTALLASSALVAPHAFAQTETVKTAPASRTTAEEVIVYGASRKGEGGGLITPQVAPKEVSTVSSAYIQTQAAIENAYQYVALTPGAMVSTADPFGLSEQFSINVHG